MSLLRFNQITPLNGSVLIDVEDLLSRKDLLASAIDYELSFTGATSRDLESRLTEVVTPGDFGADFTGVKDSTAAMRNFFAAIQNPGTTGYLPKGKVLVNDGFLITSAITIRGDKGFTLCNTNAALSKPVLDIAASAVEGTYLDGFNITSSVAVTNSAASGLRVAAGKDYIIQNIRVSDTYEGIRIAGAPYGAAIRGCFVNNTVSHGYHITDANMVVDGNYAINCGGYGYIFDTETNGAAGIMFINNTNFQSKLAGFAFIGSDAKHMSDVHLVNNLNSTTPTAPGYYFDTYGKNIMIDNCFTELAGTNYDATPNSTQPGFLITENNHRLNLTNSQATFSGGSGVDIRCSYFNITGGDYTANALVNGGSESGILVGVAGAVSDFTIVGVNTSPKSGDDVNYQTYGINVFSAGSTRGSIVGCVLSGTSKALRLDGSPDVKVTNCPGYVNEVAGTVVIPAGTSVASVTHGLSSTPTLVLLTVRDASYKCWVGSLSTSAFNVNIDSNATASTTVQYFAKCQ